jgi:hypothetical protein
LVDSVTEAEYIAASEAEYIAASEAEYIAASEVAKERVWIKNFLTKLEVVPSISGPMNLYCNNT